jgi:hypothetical protein
MKIATSLADAMALYPGWELYKDSETEIRCYAPGEIVRAAPPETNVPQEVSPLQAMLALDKAGMSAAYEAWATDPARTFAERAFINRAQVWRRDDPLMQAAATALGISPEQLDQLFALAATL